MRSALLAFVLASLAGCSTVWTRAGSTDEDFYRDQGQCEAYAWASNAPPIMHPSVYDACMRGKGWRAQ